MTVNRHIALGRSVPDPPSDRTLPTDLIADVVRREEFPAQVVEGPPVPEIDLLRKWRRETRVADLAHNRATDVLSRRNYVLGGIATLLGAIVSAGVFATLQGERAPVGVRLGAGIVAAATAGLIGLQTYLNYGARAEGHRRTSRRYDRLVHEIDQLLAASPSTVRGERLDRIRCEFAHAADAAPNVGPSAWRWADKAFAREQRRDGARRVSAAQPGRGRPDPPPAR